MHDNNLYCSNNVNLKLFKITTFTKLASLFLFLIFALFNKYLIFTLSYLIVLIFLFNINGYKLKSLIKNLCGLWYINLFIVIISIFSLNLESFLIIFLNFQIIFMFIYFIYTTTSSNELRKYFLTIFKPFNKLKLNHYKLSNFFTELVNFLPEFNYNVGKTYKAEKSRGMDFFSGGIKTKIIVILSIYKNGLKLTLRNKSLKNRMKDFMLYDDKKKIKANKSKFQLRDFVFLLIHVGLMFLLYYGEEIYYALFITFFI